MRLLKELLNEDVLVVTMLLIEEQLEEGVIANPAMIRGKLVDYDADYLAVATEVDAVPELINRRHVLTISTAPDELEQLLVDRGDLN